MPQATDLMGHGMDPFLANDLGNTANAPTCAGTTRAAAATIKTTNTELTAAGGATGAIFQSTAKIGSPYYLFNSSATSAVIYVPSGSAINTVVDDTYTLAQNKAVTFMQYKLHFWSANLTA